MADKTVFNCFKSNFVLAFGFALLHFVIGLKISRHLLSQSEVKQKPIVTNSHAFSRVWSRLKVFALSFDWLIGLSASVVICKSRQITRVRVFLPLQSVMRCLLGDVISAFTKFYYCRDSLLCYSTLVLVLRQKCNFRVHLVGIDLEQFLLS